jgi:hypothetical protein
VKPLHGAGLAAAAVAAAYVATAFAQEVGADRLVAVTLGAGVLSAVPLIAAPRRLGWRIPSARLVLGTLALALGLGGPMRALGYGHDLALATILPVALSGIGGELAFRGALARSLATEWPRWRSMGTSTLAYAFAGPTDHFVPRLVVGAIAAYVALAADTVVLPIAFHLAYVIAVSQLLVVPSVGVVASAALLLVGVALLWRAR